MISIEELEDRSYYLGHCASQRGPHIMMWDQKQRLFKYIGSTFGQDMVKRIVHEYDPGRPPWNEGFIPVVKIPEL